MNLYKTDNMAIAAYLDLNNIKYIKSEIGIGRSGKSVTYFVFEDEKQICQDLERAFRNSKEKSYRESLMFFRNEVYKMMDYK